MTQYLVALCECIVDKTFTEKFDKNVSFTDDKHHRNLYCSLAHLFVKTRADKHLLLFNSA